MTLFEEDETPRNEGTRPNAWERVAIVSGNPRSREYARRILRSMGHSPLVFLSLDELAELGPRAAELQMLFVDCEQEPGLEDDTHPLESIWEIVGLNVPLLCLMDGQLHQGSMRGVGGVRDVELQIPYHFVDLYAAFAELMRLNGLRHELRALGWSPYGFHPQRCEVEVGRRRVPLKPDEFDVALELFFRAGTVVTQARIREVLRGSMSRKHTPAAAQLLVMRLASALELDGRHGWTLESLEGHGHLLRRNGEPMGEGALWRSLPDERGGVPPERDGAPPESGGGDAGEGRGERGADAPDAPDAPEAHGHGHGRADGQLPDAHPIGSSTRIEPQPLESFPPSPWPPADPHG